ncbi:MAG: hypothetical protein QNK33_02520, partial [Bacteroidales bacterium]|nr:hypothetical protein [Bacteroidales bacterium]
NEISVFEPDSQVATMLKANFNYLTLVDSPRAAATQELVFLAVHPPVLKEVFGQINDVIGEATVVISLAPKITLEKMASVLSSSSLVRMIPNATSFINDGYNPISFNCNFGEGEKIKVMNLFEVLGECFEVEEEKLEAYAIVSAMLPTYFWFQWAKIREIAMRTGLEDEESKEIIYQTLIRSLNFFYNSDLSTEGIIDLIPVKPIGEHEAEIEKILETKLLGLFDKIKP